MKTYAVLQVLSTGYIDGTIPPKFSDDNKKPIDMLAKYNLLFTKVPHLIQIKYI